MSVTRAQLTTLFKNLIQLAVESTKSTPYTVTNIRGVNVRPPPNSLGMAKIGLVTLSSLYFGGLLASRCAAYLEENEIFVPAEDDDDDDD